MTHQQKISKTAKEYGCNKKSATGIVYMLDWMAEKQEALTALWKKYRSETASDMPFNEFCYGIWPKCMQGYILKRKLSDKAQYKSSAIQAQE